MSVPRADVAIFHSAIGDVELELRREPFERRRVARAHSCGWNRQIERRRVALGTRNERAMQELAGHVNAPAKLERPGDPNWFLLLLPVAFGVRLFAVAFGGLLVLGLLVLGLALAFGVDLHALPCVDLLAAPTLLGPFALRSESPGGGVARRRLWRFWRLCAGMGCE